jgi:uncharacterized RDD family membrane protein YckC
VSRLVILTPEHVEVELQPAGLGSRFIAFMVDLVLILGATSVVARVIHLVLPGAGSGAVVATVGFLISWGYHVYFEVRHQGRSPGKRLIKLRVVDGRGLPLTVQQSFVRNVVRALDMAPVAYGLGALACRLDPAHRRLGDRLADTLVIRDAEPFAYERRETRSRAFNSLRTPRVLRLIRRRVSLDEREFLLKLVPRADALDHQVRFDLMQEVGEHYRKVLALDDPHLSGESLVRGLAAILSAGR